MEHPILKNPGPGCMIKIQKRSESNVLSKLPYWRKKRLRKCWSPTTTWNNPRFIRVIRWYIEGYFFFQVTTSLPAASPEDFTLRKERFFRLPVARKPAPWYNINSPHLSNRTVMLMQAKIKGMATGKPLPLIISFSLPLMVGNVFQQLYTAVN